MASKRSKTRQGATMMHELCGVIDARAMRRACRVWDLLDRRGQLAIAEEIVRARARELCRAYPNVVNVSFGHRRRRHAASCRHRVVEQICVRFLVSRKWRKGRDGAGEIPKRLLTFCSLAGKRELCAVPTDVEDATPHLRVRAQGMQIAATWEGISDWGALTCAVRRNTVPDRIYGLSCRHVLSVSTRFFDELTWGATVQVGSPEGDEIGPTRAIAGDLNETDSFDAQLVEAKNLIALRQALMTPGVRRYVTEKPELPSAYQIVAPTRTIGARFVDFLDAQYDIDTQHRIRHLGLVQSQPVSGTNPGESGSPVVSEDGRTLLGMHVAGLAMLDSSGTYITISYMIPTWELFNPGNYGNVAGTEQWTIVANP